MVKGNWEMSPHQRRAREVPGRCERRWLTSWGAGKQFETVASCMPSRFCGCVLAWTLHSDCPEQVLVQVAPRRRMELQDHVIHENEAKRTHTWTLPCCLSQPHPIQLRNSWRPRVRYVSLQTPAACPPISWIHSYVVLNWTNIKN